jgi:uncharacterized protein YoxC
MPLAPLNPIASTFLVVFYLLSGLILIGLLAALAFLVFKLNALLEKYERKIDPLLAKADEVLTTTTEKVNSIGTKAEEILTQGEELTEMVHTRVDTTTQAVQKTVFTPLIGVNSLIAGVKRGAETFARRQQQTLSGVPSQTSVNDVVPVPLASDPVITSDTVPDDLLPVSSDANNSRKFDQTANRTDSYSVNKTVSNGAELQPVSLGTRKDNG